MATKIRSKGTVLQMSISAVYTTIPALIDISISGAKSEVADTTSLDGGTEMTAIPNGNTTRATITANGFYDPVDSTIVAFIALKSAVPPVATNFKVIRTNTALTATVWSGVGFGFDENYSLSDAAKCTYTIETSGAPA